MILWKFSLREIRSRPGRATLTLLSIVLGVASVVAVTLATGAARQAYKDLFSAVAGKADLAVTNDGADGFSDDAVADLDQIPGFAAVAPSLQKPVKMYGQTPAGRDIHVTLQAMGVDPKREAAVRASTLAEGRYFERNGEAVVDAGFARNIGLAVGQKIRLGARTGNRTEFEIVGLVKLQGAAGIANAGIIFIPLGQAQRLFGARGKVDAIHLVFQPDVDKLAVQKAAAAVLPPELTIAPPASGSQLAEESMLSPETGLFIASSLSIVVAAFIILNTFFMNVSERRRQLAILRAIGATRGQILGLLLTEGAVLGVVGTLLGMGAGVVGAFFLARAMEGLFQTTLPSVPISATPFWLAAVFGNGVSLLSTFIPAYFAGLVSPLEGMGGMVRTDAATGRDKLFWLGPTLIVIGSALMALAVFDQMPAPVLNSVAWVFSLFGAAETIGPEIVISLSGTVLQLVGFIFLLRGALGPLVSAAAFVLSPILRVEARLGRQQLLRRRTRTALTIGVLFMVVSTGVGMGNTLLDNVQDVQNWYRRTIIGDFFVRVMMPDMITGETADIPDGVREEIERIPGVMRIGSAKFTPARAAGQQVVVIAREFRIHDGARLDLKDTDPVKARERLLAGEVIISTVLAERTGLRTGDEITIDAQHGPAQLKIAGTANDYIVSGLILYMDRGTAERLLGIEGANAIVVDAEKEAYGPVEAALKEICIKHEILLQSQAEINSMIDGMMSGVIACQWAILVLGFCVAGFGMVNTLTMNVLEQTRELGLLRVVAMTRWQVRRLIFAQAIMIGLIGLLPGVGFGVLMAWFINFSTLAVTGHPVELVLRPMLLAGTFVAGLLIVLIAASFPAERAARLDLPTALQYE